MTILHFLIIVLLFGIGLAIPLRLNYLRYFYNFEKEINEYLQKSNLKLLEQHSPSGLDWDNAPFPKEKWIKPAVFFIEGTHLSQSKYYIINTSSEISLWLKVEIYALQGTKLHFRKSPQKLAPRSAQELKNQSTSPCPACSYPIVASDQFCPDCGIRLF
ncbi:zinc ribbon domain-containing protein [Croceimicrobium hydrocarbonivorans]|uniref:Zinc ribbon domain-containing protein n=1 Tax=Croceimicrobium hydrocarbonivorans TaxID=2761580 RepID=A0A7H0VCL6_9FLAO|nr:zinc ribbon domain-containing protein [Croceimicrobium hydrocarbonivorans]QNR23464.1 hypothetical protein H4K34_13910 [Croceimicrobium hydrocarbonivorans]